MRGQAESKPGSSNAEGVAGPARVCVARGKGSAQVGKSLCTQEGFAHQCNAAFHAARSVSVAKRGKGKQWQVLLWRTRMKTGCIHARMSPSHEGPPHRLALISMRSKTTAYPYCRPARRKRSRCALDHHKVATHWHVQCL